MVGSVTVDVLDLHFLLLVASPTLSSGKAVRCRHSEDLATLHNTTRQTEIPTSNFSMGIFHKLDMEETCRETIKLCKDNIEQPVFSLIKRGDLSKLSCDRYKSQLYIKEIEDCKLSID